jgi:hypothetical protein
MNPLDFIPKTALAVLIVILTVLNLKAHWSVNSLTAEVANGKTQIAQLEGAIDKANAKSAEISETLTRKVLDAQSTARKREAALLADAAATNDALDSLRLSTSKARAAYRLSGPAATTSYQYADTGLDLLDICAKEYSDLAAKADGHASDVETLITAWPEVQHAKQ